MRARLLLGALGIAIAAYGAGQLVAADVADLVNTALWLTAGVVLHDFVLVPVTLGACWLGMRLLPPGRRAPVAAGLVVLGTLTVLAVPVLGGWGANSDNATILDRDYPARWVVVAGLTVAGVVASPVVGPVIGPVIGPVVGLAFGRRQRGPRARGR